MNTLFAIIAGPSTSSSCTATPAGPITGTFSPGIGFVSDLLVYSVLFYIAALLAIAVKSATGVTTERDAETWDGILSTLLEPVEIVRAKVLGAISGQRA